MCVDFNAICSVQYIEKIISRISFSRHEDHYYFFNQFISDHFLIDLPLCGRFCCKFRRYFKSLICCFFK